MSTAKEVLMKIEEARPVMNAMQEVIADSLIEELLMRVVGKPVCARRARKLRKKGNHVRWAGRTKTGKSIYLWAPLLRIEI